MSASRDEVRSREPQAIGEEAVMAAKDKGGKNKKQAATRTLKEKRQAKRDKKGAKAAPAFGTSRA